MKMSSFFVSPSTVDAIVTPVARAIADLEDLCQRKADEELDIMDQIAELEERKCAAELEGVRAGVMADKFRNLLDLDAE